MRGENPSVIRRLPGGFAVMGDVQWLPGYCLLLTDDPAAERLSDLPRPLEFLESMDQLGRAVENACSAADTAFRRINIEILGNTDPFLHAHIWPRYTWESDERWRGPVRLHARERWHDPATALGPQHDALRAAIAVQLDREQP